MCVRASGTQSDAVTCALLCDVVADSTALLCEELECVRASGMQRCAGTCALLCGGLECVSAAALLPRRLAESSVVAGTRGCESER